VDTFYSQYTKRVCTNQFDETKYRALLMEKLQRALGVDRNWLTRQEVEYSYPAFRLRYWTCLDNSNNTRKGHFLMPFISYSIIRLALRLPLSRKNCGDFQARLITKVSPRLASYSSDYGYPFNTPVPTCARLKHELNCYRPNYLRRYSYSIKDILKRRSLVDSFSYSLCRSVFPQGLHYMAKYFNECSIKDLSVLKRIYSVEYLYEHFGV